jgi:hypothetical protein
VLAANSQLWGTDFLGKQFLNSTKDDQNLFLLITAILSWVCECLLIIRLNPAELRRSIEISIRYAHSDFNAASLN